MSANSTPESSVVLYTGDHCHLCHQAKELIYPLLSEQQVSLVEINISANAELKDKYGLRIPVLAMPNGEEKGWPFTAGQVKRLLTNCFT